MKKTLEQPTFAAAVNDELPWELRDRDPSPMFMVLKSENAKSLEKLAIFINQNSKTFTEKNITAAITNASRDIFTGVFNSRWHPEKIVSYLTGNFAGYTELKPLSSPFNEQTDHLLILPIAAYPAAITSAALTSWLTYHCAPQHK